MSSAQRAGGKAGEQLPQERARESWPTGTGPGETGITGVRSEELRPVPAEEGPPAARRLSPGEWVRENLFSGPANTALTLVFAPLLVWVVFKAAVFVFVSSDWSVVEVNLTNFMVGRFPREQLPRLWIAIAIVALVVGMNAGVARRARPDGVSRWRGLRPLVPPALLLVVVLSFTETVLPAVLSLAVIVVGVAGAVVGRRLPAGVVRRLWLVNVAAVLVAYAVCTAAGGAGYELWGGLLLNVFAAVAAVLLSFPVGVLLALGRRSTLPVVRLVSVVYIELIRGVPLITLLFMAGFMLGFVYPDFIPRPSDVTAGIIVFIMFTAAYIAEIVRGGLQGVPSGQVEAAKAIGLRPWKTTRLIVLPQALRSVIPAVVGQFISITKDTTLLSFLSILELLTVAQVVTQQPAFLAGGYQAQTLTFVASVFWVICYSMSKAAQRVERRMGVGER